MLGRPDHEQLVHEGLARTAAGELAAAEEAFARAVAANPRDHRAHHALAVIAIRTGRSDVAVVRARSAHALDRRNHEYLNTLGIACGGCGRLQDAADAFRRAVRERPAYPEAWCNLGLALRRLGELDEAARALRRAAALAPGDARAQNELGVTLQAAGRVDEAIEAFRGAVSNAPDDPDAHNNLGMALRRAGRLDEGVAALREARVRDPGNAVVANNLGIALQALGSLDEARECLEEAVAMRPDFADAHANLGLALKQAGELEAAETALRRAIALEPGSADFLTSLGGVLQARGRSAEARAALEQALAIAPEHTGALTSLGLAALAEGRVEEGVVRLERCAALRPESASAANNLAGAYRMQGDMARAVACCRRALELDPQYLPARSNLLASLNYLPDVSTAEILAEHRRLGESIEAPLRNAWPAHVNVRDPERRLRIGYVSGDFRSHAMAFSIAPVLAHHDAERFHVVCYANNADEDDVTARLRAAAHEWRRVAGLSDEAMAEAVQRDGIDVLVDLSGHTALNRLGVFARKPAPVQAAWLGYVTSTGLAAMDCRLTDGHADPVGEDDAGYIETLVRLPWVTVFEPSADSPAIAPLPALHGGPFTFACLNHLAKVNAAVVALWARILAAVPGSRLLLGNAGDAGVQRRLAEAFAGHGIPVERLAFRPRMPLAAFLAMHSEIDLALDTFPYAGGATSCHSLWMGVPFVTLVGDRYMARMGLSLLEEVGLGELAARTADDYVAIAARAARDPACLARLRATMRERLAASPLVDGAAFVRNLEAAYRAMWRAWCADPAPGFARRAQLDAAVLPRSAAGSPRSDRAKEW